VRATTRPILAAFLVVLTILAAAASAAARPGAAIEWRPCTEDPTAQCATVRVPVDWSDPYSPKAGIALARRPATDPAHRIGVLVVNPGGPGGSGVDFALGADAFFSPTLRSRFDIVGFDPRGVSRSNPVMCSSALVAAAPEPLITSRASYDATVAYNRRLAADCARRTGPMFAHVDTVSVARDLDLIRSALGAEQITFYGASYGTLLGAQYAQLYPERVRALVLDSVMDHSAGVGDFLGTETAATQDAFDEFVAWCARDVTCVLHGQDVKAIWAGLLARAAAGTLLDPYAAGRRVTVFGLLEVAFSSFYEPQWYSLAYYLKEARLSGPVARLSGPVARLSRPVVVGRRAATAVEHSFPAVFCTDWALPVGTYPALAAELGALRARAPQMLASPLALTAAVGCLGWPARPVNPQRDLRPIATPALVVGSRHDPATAYAWARHVATQLGPGTRLFTYEGWGHVSYNRTDCVAGVVDAYLVTRRTPAAGASCPGVVPPPFGVGKRSLSPPGGGDRRRGSIVSEANYPGFAPGGAVEPPRAQSVHRP
jgi:pimeloyl-ACP methyl ester carboxylesterase